MRRILITGNAGSGKTTLANKLTNILGIQSFHLDNIVWKPHWKMTEPTEKKQKISEITKRDTWIIDGVSKDALLVADTIVFLDVPRHVCFLRALKRNIRHLFKSRPDLPENCPEILIIFTLIKIIWNFPKKVRPFILQSITKNANSKQTFHIKSDADLDEFLNHVINMNKSYCIRP